ncbi:MAG: hypothetical protein KDN22_12265 [Verrucomicrobiae bacterium]|nr:hypothetical protein [Verrucomicrobiae bacterium]
MATYIIIAFLAGFVAVIIAIGKVASGRVSKWLGIIYLSLVVAAGCIAAFTTFHYVYFMDPNTRFHGWPIPTVVFQRVDADSPWLDFVGPTSFLAYPMNVILFLVGPSVVLLAWTWLKHPSTKKQESENERL